MAGCDGRGRVAPKIVDVPGLGKVAEYFNVTTDHFAVESTRAARYNRHNEGRVEFSCAKTVFEDLTDELVDDDTIITAQNDKDTYKVTVSLNGDADILFYAGPVTSTFVFHKATGLWSWKPTKVEDGKDEEYKSCVPQKALKAVFASLDCYSATDGKNTPEGNTVLAVVASLKQQTELLASNAAIYKDGDCEYVWTPPETSAVPSSSIDPGW